MVDFIHWNLWWSYHQPGTSHVGEGGRKLFVYGHILHQMYADATDIESHRHNSAYKSSGNLYTFLLITEICCIMSHRMKITTVWVTWCRINSSLTLEMGFSRHQYSAQELISKELPSKAAILISCWVSCSANQVCCCWDSLSEAAINDNTKVLKCRFARAWLCNWKLIELKEHKTKHNGLYLL